MSGPIDRLHTAHVEHPSGAIARLTVWTPRCPISYDYTRCEREEGHDGECRATSERGRRMAWRDSAEPTNIKR